MQKSFYNHTHTLIEPLVGVFRSFSAVRCVKRSSFFSYFFKHNQPTVPTGDKGSMMSMDYILLGAHHQNPGPKRRSILFDIGASEYNSLSQKWMLETYEELGVSFDRHLLWEPNVKDHQRHFDTVPARFHHAYQLFTARVTSDVNDPRNPLNILRVIAAPKDFVVFKIDIDHNGIEMEFIRQILNDSEISSRIDAFMWEPHFNFAPMIECCWKTTADPNLQPTQVWDVLFQLRNLGVHAHGWP